MKIAGVKVFEPDVFTDYRGDLWTIWKSGQHNLDFNHDKVSTSRKNVLRGIHGDFKSHKLVTCLQGELYFVMVDNRPESATYLQWDWLILNDRTRKQVLLPPGVGNGFLVLSDNSVFHYKWSYSGEYPDVEDQFTIKWDDQRLNINWGIDKPILQARDK
jgi:dTDP-4-dehydrorhamnose 3,5-epimerase|tara:strand:- start:256 stop:732 length:477 start_codon:yes stop_codon:yes gene_type:complete